MDFRVYLFQIFEKKSHDYIRKPHIREKTSLNFQKILSKFPRICSLDRDNSLDCGKICTEYLRKSCPILAIFGKIFFDFSGKYSSDFCKNAFMIITKIVPEFSEKSSPDFRKTRYRVIRKTYIFEKILSGLLRKFF